MIAIQNAHASDLSYLHRLVSANQNAEAFGLSSTLAKAEEEDEVQVVGCCHDQDDGCSAEFHPSSSLL